jgi:hypothetical protein
VQPLTQGTTPYCQGNAVLQATCQIVTLGSRALSVACCWSKVTPGHSAPELSPQDALLCGDLVLAIMEAMVATCDLVYMGLVEGASSKQAPVAAPGP